MNTDRTSVALAAVITAITLGVGAFLLAGSSGATAPPLYVEPAFTAFRREVGGISTAPIVGLAGWGFLADP